MTIDEADYLPNRVRMISLGDRYLFIFFSPRFDEFYRSGNLPAWKKIASPAYSIGQEIYQS